MSLIVELPAPSWNSAQVLPIKTLAVTGPDPKEGLLFSRRPMSSLIKIGTTSCLGEALSECTAAGIIVPFFPEFTDVIAQAVAAHPAHLAPFPGTETA